MRKDLHEANRLSWNAATQAHNSHKIDQAGFLRRGGSTLFAEELALLGDVRGLRIAHLQCNAGQDSLSLAALGALVTGVDISDEAIAFVPPPFDRQRHCGKLHAGRHIRLAGTGGGGKPGFL